MISTAVLADAPVVYWKLDDPNGPAASDSSGNGNPGVYSGTFQLGKPGPEVGTNAALFQDGALVYSFGPTPRLVRPYSMDCWLAAEQIQPQQQNGQYNGNGSANGIGWGWNLGVSLTQPIDVLVGGIAIGAPAGALLVAAWHHVAFTTDVTQITDLYVDGVQVYTANTGPINAIAAADKFQVGGNKPGQLCYMAHAALYPSVLPPARVLAHFNANATPQPPTSATGVTSGDIASILATLAEILAAVKRAF